MLEANTGLYKWGSRVSVLTGLPTVVGWDWHQRQQRGDFSPMVERTRARRPAHVRQTPDWSQLITLLQKYHVQYIYVGPLERAYYSEAGLRKFRDLVGSVLDLCTWTAPVDGVVDFTKGAQIYRVKDSVLNAPPTAHLPRQPAAECPPALAACPSTPSGSYTAADARVAQRAVTNSGPTGDHELMQLMAMS